MTLTPPRPAFSTTGTPPRSGERVIKNTFRRSNGAVHVRETGRYFSFGVVVRISTGNTPAPAITPASKNRIDVWRSKKLWWWSSSSSSSRYSIPPLFGGVEDDCWDQAVDRLVVIVLVYLIDFDSGGLSSALRLTSPDRDALGLKHCEVRDPLTLHCYPSRSPAVISHKSCDFIISIYFLWWRFPR